MRAVPGFDMGEVIYRGAETTLLRAQSKLDGRRVILKMATAENPSARALRYLSNEYTVGKLLSSSFAAAAHSLETIDGQPYLVIDDINAEPLESFVGRPVKLDWFFDVAISLADAVAELHRTGIVHKD